MQLALVCHAGVGQCDHSEHPFRGEQHVLTHHKRKTDPRTYPQTVTDRISVWYLAVWCSGRKKQGIKGPSQKFAEAH